MGSAVGIFVGILADGEWGTCEHALYFLLPPLQLFLPLPQLSELFELVFCLSGRPFWVQVQLLLGRSHCPDRCPDDTLRLAQCKRRHLSLFRHWSHRTIPE